ncbi:MAG TPA: threonine synthase [Oscillospiraceae bacterium]|nr:threonine synthase [Oscillospiraceae bacterium]HPF55744.1 threonine synthase [Clostridiales bacterium]HPK34259.1 threonine synthase [Oscillospiraceae bacterium]HPR74838.1 threonine synthase [Oscillospiraceae bacterium]
MEFCSTRDQNLTVSAAHAILNGLAPDGGLFVPKTLPSFSLAEIAELSALDYRGCALKILPKFLPGYSEEELSSYIEKAYGDNFETADPAPIKGLGDGIFSLELFHGPTCAFKDFALQLLPYLLTSAAEKCGCDKEIAILTATSGDTGKAALSGFSDVKGTRICVFYPDGGISEIQRLQMSTQKGNNVNVLAVKGNFDDTQNGVKAIFTDPSVIQELDKRKIILSSANSINWGRLAPQIVYYFYAYAKMVSGNAVKPGAPVNFCVPTGNFGNILAGYFAKKSGLPVDKLLCASNQNNILTDFINTGVYDKNRAFYLTNSPSMDILISSNLERLLFLLGGDEKVRQFMRSLSETGRYEIGDELLSTLHKEGFCAYFCDENATDKCIADTWANKAYLCDTHTAVGFDVLRQYQTATGDRTTTAVLSTASPFKFASSILHALGQPVPKDGFNAIDALDEFSKIPAPKQLKNIRNLPVRFDQIITRSAMKQSVLDWLK